VEPTRLSQQSRLVSLSLTAKIFEDADVAVRASSRAKNVRGSLGTAMECTTGLRQGLLLARQDLDVIPGQGICRQG
jgi:hypothetical protein